MGQYYLVVNLDKEQYIHPREFGDGLKLMEFGASANGTMTGLALLLADGSTNSDDSLIGSWAGDRIVIAGDYADGGRFIPAHVQDHELQELADEVFTKGLDCSAGVNIHILARRRFEDISAKVAKNVRDST